MKLESKFYEFKCEELINSDSHPEHKGILINYDVLLDSDKESIINSMEFSINKNAIRTDTETNDEEDLGKPCWKLVDLQGGNLANIEADEFFVDDYDAILDRLDNYYHDYGYYFLYELETLNVNYTVISELENI